jgi:hypothetical protein
MDVILAARVLLKKSPRNDYSPQRLEFDKDVSFRRHALIKACNRAFERGETLSKLTEQLVADADKFRSFGHFDEWAKNLGMARRLTREMTGDPDKAHRYVEIVLDSEKKVSHKWELMEQKVSAANYLYSKNDKRHAFEKMSQALEAYSQHPLLLEPVLETEGPKQYQIHDHVLKLGITYQALIDCGVPIHPPISDIPLQLNNADIFRIVKGVLAG